MDEMDIVQEREQRDRDHAIAVARARIAASFAPRDTSVDGACITCGSPIDPARIAALRGCVSDCIECARVREQRQGAIG